MTVATVLIIISSVALALLVAFKVYEHRSGRTMWKRLRLEILAFIIERITSKLLNRLHKIDARTVSYYIRESGIILLQFYRAIQRISAERFADISNPHPADHGNKAASFYLKNIKEHKEKEILTSEEVVEVFEENSDKNLPA